MITLSFRHCGWHTKTMKHILINTTLLVTLLFHHMALAASPQIVLLPKYNTRNYDLDIRQLYQTMPRRHNASVATRIERISQRFLDKPYYLGSLGEGPHGKFDQSPLYRTDKFDCVTYVSTVLTLAHADNLPQFKRLIQRTRYQNGEARYIQRNHFMSVDWNKYNAYRGYVRDITYKFTDKQGKPVALIAKTTINKPNWIRHRSGRDIKLLNNVSEKKAQQLLAELRAQAKRVQQEESVMLYIPLNKLFDANGKPNQHLFKQIPTGSIIEVIRPNWNTKKILGTRMNVSHLGFAIRTPQKLIFRVASSLQHKIIDIPLWKYLKAYRQSPSIKGINVQLVT